MGGPFWFNIVASLSRFLDVKRSPGGSQVEDQEKKGSGTTKTDDGKEQPRTPVEIFEVAAAGAKIKDI